MMKAPLSETPPSGTAKLSIDPSNPVPRWVTSWPDWYGIHDNVAVVPASDYDALLASGTAKTPEDVWRDAVRWRTFMAERTAASRKALCDHVDKLSVGAPSPDGNEEKWK